MLDTAFPRLLGDIGNPQSFDYPVKYAVVPGATPNAIVRGDTSRWVQAFIQAGQNLVADGCTALTTTCGFLTPLRAEVAKATGVPVVSSALEQVPGLLGSRRRPGVLTISAQSLNKKHLMAAGVPLDTPIQGVDGGHFSTTILENRTDLEWSVSEQEMVNGARILCRSHPDVDVIVLECTNMPPYTAAIEAETRRPVVSILTAVDALHRANP